MIAPFILLAAYQAPVLMRVRPQKGSKYVYNITFRMEAGKNGSLDSSVPMIENFAGMNGANQLWTVTFQKPTVKGTGQFASAADTVKENYSNVKITFERTSTFRPVSASMENKRVPIDFEKEGSSEMIFSDKPVKPGDTWLGKIKAGGTVLDVTYKYIGPSAYNGIKTWKIESIPSGRGVVVVKPYIWQVDQKDGRTITSNGRLKVLSNGSMIDLTFNVVRISRTPK